jgi:hypothetical protein
MELHMPSITLYYPRTKNLKNRAFKIETCERRKMGDSQRGRSGVDYEKGFGGHRERKG